MSSYIDDGSHLNGENYIAMEVLGCSLKDIATI